MMRSFLRTGVTSSLALSVLAEPASAQTATAADVAASLDVVWVTLCAALVFFMQAGFAMVECGLTRAKNAATIVMKNLSDFAMGTIAYWLVGFALMFGAGNALFGTSGFFTSGAFDLPLPTPVYFVFQVVFAGTAATIVSGAVAERMKFASYLVVSFMMTALIYPVVGHWIWGGGWLATRAVPFHDFAGSTVVHSVGGWAALVGAAILGPRLGKYAKDGKPLAIPGHSMPMAMLGVFILWFGWFGFNAGSTLGATGQGELIGHVLLTTTLAGAIGGVFATAAVWLRSGKPDVAMAGNGVLAGLVGVTAGCAFVGPLAALGIGALAGVVVVSGVFFFDRIGVDDPVGAISVHGLCGALGTVWIGLFADGALTLDGSAGLLMGGGTALLATQALGVVAVFAWVAVTAGIVFALLRATVGIRVSEHEEIEGLDVGEHGLPGYPDFALSPGATVHGIPAPATATRAAPRSVQGLATE